LAEVKERETDMIGVVEFVEWECAVLEILDEAVVVGGETRAGTFCPGKFERPR
jgi:hypothetical protein